jgi:hypothetical protein
MFCFLDRANIGNSRLAGLETELGMTGADYNILLTAFYVAYIVFELPSNLLCKAIGPGKWWVIYFILVKRNKKRKAKG